VLEDDVGHRLFVRGFGEGSQRPGFLRKLNLVADGANIQAGAAAGALGRIYESGLFFDNDFKIPRLAINLLDIGQGM
jgi:hypothetical protein